MNYSTEDIYQLLAKSEWNKLLDFESKYRTRIVNDNTLKKIFDSFFINQVIEYISTENDKQYCALVLNKIYKRFLHHRNKTYSIPDKQFEEFVAHYIQILISINDLKLAYNISKNWSQISIAKEFVREYEKTNPEEIYHSNSNTIKVSINSNIQKENYTIPLFKSNQEYEFFYAVRESYPNYYTYPNVAVSCIIDYNKIKNNLTNQEKEYFFKAIIDSVVFEELENNYIPKFYFELDSIYHDQEKQKEKDIIKDKIFSLAGQKLLRIREKNNSNLNRNDFKKLIKELLK